jgi:hypothetical protein
LTYLKNPINKYSLTKREQNMFGKMWHTPKNVGIGEFIRQDGEYAQAINTTKLIGDALLKAGLKNLSLSLELNGQTNGRANLIVSLPLRIGDPMGQEKISRDLSMMFMGDTGNTQVGKSSFSVHIEEKDRDPKGFAARLQRIYEVDIRRDAQKLSGLIQEYERNSTAKPEPAKSSNGYQRY